MKEKFEQIVERKKKINDLCGELRWVYRGYFTSIYDFLPIGNILTQIETFNDKLVSYDEELNDIERDMYKAFFTSAILFVRNYCRPSELIFYSIYKIGTVIEDSWNDKLEFDKSIYGYMCEPYADLNEEDEYYQIFINSTQIFASLYDNKEIDKENFSYHISKMFDLLLFDNNKSYLLDKNYDDGIKKLNYYIGDCKFQLHHSLCEEITDD